jgi:hypothetical protein
VEAEYYKRKLLDYGVVVEDNLLADSVPAQEIEDSISMDEVNFEEDLTALTNRAPSLYQMETQESSSQMTYSQIQKALTKEPEYVSLVHDDEEEENEDDYFDEDEDIDLEDESTQQMRKILQENNMPFTSATQGSFLDDDEDEDDF